MLTENPKGRSCDTCPQTTDHIKFIHSQQPEEKKRRDRAAISLQAQKKAIGVRNQGKA